jgi:hypothetical protein
MNGIESLGPRILCASRELILLNLSKNKINSITSESFSCLQKLSNLYLNENKISYIDSALFKSNKMLLLLDLRINALKTVASDAFQNNRLLSLFLIENNYVVLNGTFLNSLKTSLNVLEIAIFKSDEISLISYQRLPRLQDLNRNTSKQVPVRELLSSQTTELSNVIKLKLEEVKYGLEDYLYYNATLSQITTLSGNPVLCHCDRMSLWFWCSKQRLAPVGLTHVYETLKCNQEHGQEIHNRTKGADSHPNKGTDQTIVYVSVATAAVCLIVTAVAVTFLVRRKCKQATKETGWYLDQNSFVFRRQRDDNVYEEVHPVAV